MKIAVFGASGPTGQEVVKQALEIKQKDETNLSSDAQSGNDGASTGNFSAFSMNLQAFAGDMG